MPQPRRRTQTVARNIHFYRAVVRAGPTKGKLPDNFNPTTALERIDALTFDADGRYHEDGDRTLCGWVDKASEPARVRLAVIRREGLPWVERRGVLEALQIPAAAGLVEQIHVRFFDHNIVGCDFNFYGPRLPTLGRYLRAKGGPSVQKVDFEPLVRQDVAALMEQYNALRVFTLRVRRADLDLLEKLDASLAAAFRAQEKLSKADELEIVLRPKAYSRGNLGKNMLARAKRLAKHKDIDGLATRFKVEMIPGDGGASQEINILDDHLISEQPILRQPGRGRALDADSAYQAIDQAYEELKEELLRAASIDGRPSRDQ